MKKKLIFILFGILLMTFNSCENDEQIIYCQEILVLQKLAVNYFDENGNDLLFSNNPEFDVENISIYKESGGQKQEINYGINEETKSISIHLNQAPEGIFFIELEPNVIDEIRFEGILDDTRLPCEEYNIVKLFQNEMEVSYNNELSVWELKK
ncbi:hypothetical protein [Sphingobacterium hungaricum]